MAEARERAGAARRPIALLDEGTIAGIAAGEVVERPASAVKELVENALDAGAGSVRVDYDDGGGATRLVVTDDGSGIPEGEIELALTRHATSKIRRLDDVEGVGTFGFRGEALAAIASASDLDLVTCVEGATGGTRVVVRAGRVAERMPAPSRRGTRVDVRDLFAAVPARRKFLKSAAVEAGAVADVVRRFAIARPDVEFTLVSSGRTVLAVPAVGGGAERIRQVLGKEVAASLVDVDARLGPWRLTGFASRPGASWGSARRMSLYVGGRWVREKLLFQAVLDGYQTYLLKGRYPAVALFLDGERGGVDVNVHPAKLEVRFADPDGVRRFVAEAVRDALRRSASPLGRWGLDAAESLRRDAAAAPSRSWQGPAPLPRAAGPAVQGDVRPRESALAASPSPGRPDLAATGVAGEAVAPADRIDDAAQAAYAAGHVPGYVPSVDAAPSGGEQLAIDLGPAEAADALGRFDVVGQIFDGYFVCEGDGQVLLVDQHAAHERILFERLTEAFASRRVAIQDLLVPVQVHVGRAAVESVAEAARDLEALGWLIEPFGDEEVVVRGVPAMAASADPGPMAEAVARDLVELGRARSAERLAERILATVACHSAVRVGKRLDAVAARALLRDMATVSYHSTCPHGRPVARTLSRGQVERMFGR